MCVFYIWARSLTQINKWKPLGERDYFAKLLVDTNADADRCWWMLMLMGTDGRWGWWTLMMTDADANRRWGTLMLTDAGGRWCGQWQTLMMSYDADGRWCWWSPQPKFFDGGSVFPKRLSTENILQPTRSLYDVWFKSYGSLCVCHVWGDLDLDRRPVKVIIFVWGQHIPISV